MEEIKSVLVTGATGFIGSHLVFGLIQEGFDVAIIKRENSDTYRIKNILSKLHVYNADICDSEKVSDIISSFKPDAIFHLAAYYAISHKTQEMSCMIDTNVLGTINLLDAAKNAGVKFFANTSTCFVYEDCTSNLREDAELSPVNLYALTKMQAEFACLFYSKKYKLKTITFRLFPPYGPYDSRRKLIPYLIMSLLKGEPPRMTTGKQKWDFIYVDDIINAYIKLASNYQNLSNEHEIINLGTGSAISVQEISSLVKGIIGTELDPLWGSVPHRDNEVWFLSADITKAKNLLNWTPKRQIGEGLSNTINWCKELLEYE